MISRNLDADKYTACSQCGNSDESMARHIKKKIQLIVDKNDELFQINYENQMS